MLVRSGTDRSVVARGVSRLLLADIRKYDEVKRVMKPGSFDVVIHLAALVQRSGSVISRQEYFSTNVEGTRNLCYASLESGVKRFVHISTADVHGSGHPGEIMDEQSPYAPVTDYERSKAEAERVVLNILKGFEPIVLRPTFVYGNPSSAFFKWLFAYARSPIIPVLGPGLALKHYVHVSDLAEAIVLAMRDGRSGRAYIIADEKPIAVNELLAIATELEQRYGKLVHLPFQRAGIMAMSKVFPWRLAYAMKWFYTNRAYRITSAVSDLRYKPRVRLRNGLTQLLQEMSH